MMKDTLLRIIKNHINLMPKVYRKRNSNAQIVQELIQFGTSQAGWSSSIKKCVELGIDPSGYTIPENIEKQKRLDYANLPSRGKKTSKGIYTENCVCGGRTYVFYEEMQMYNVQCEYCDKQTWIKGNSLDDAIMQWNTISKFKI